MGIIEKLKNSRENREKHIQFKRDIEEDRLRKAAEKETRELQADTRVHNLRKEVSELREKRRKINPGFLDRFNRPNSSPNPMYGSAIGETKKRVKKVARHTYNTASNPNFHSEYNNFLGSSLFGSSAAPRPTKLKHKHSKPVYIKKGKRYIKVKGNHKSRHSHRPIQRDNDIFGGGGVFGW